MVVGGEEGLRHLLVLFLQGYARVFGLEASPLLKIREEGRGGGGETSMKGKRVRKIDVVRALRQRDGGQEGGGQDAGIASRGESELRSGTRERKTRRSAEGELRRKSEMYGKGKEGKKEREAVLGS